MVSHRSLSDSKSPQVSRTFLSVLANLSNAGVWMVSTRPFISNSFRPCINPLMTVSRGTLIIGITITFIFYSFFNSLSRSRYLSFFSLSFNFTVVRQDSKVHNSVSSLFLLLIITRSGHLAEIRWSNSISKS